MHTRQSSREHRMRLHPTPSQTISSRNSSPRNRWLKRAEKLAAKGQLDDRTKSEGWAFVADGGLDGATVQALVELDTARRTASLRAEVRAGKQEREDAREAVRLAWARAVPAWLLRSCNLPPATWSVFGMLISRAGERHGEWRAELSFTEMQRRLGGSSRDTVAGAVKRLERHGFIRAIRRRRCPHFSEVNVYVLEHPLAVQAAAGTPWRHGAASGEVSKSPGARTHSHQKEKTTSTKIQGREHCSRRLQESEGGREPAPPEPEAPILVEPSADPPCLDPRAERERPPDVAQDVAEQLAEAAAAQLEIAGGDLAERANEALALYAPQLAPWAWRSGIARHGARRAALAALEVARLVCLRNGTSDPIRSPAAYLAGTLRKPPGQCRPEATLRRLDRLRSACNGAA